MNNQIMVGSLSAISEQKGQSLAESFMSADCLIMVDTSGSMGTKDSTGGKSRYDQACSELAALQKSMPGKLAVISFSSDVKFCPSGLPEFLQQSTDMAAGLRFIKIADVTGMKFILISDGQPDAPEQALHVAKTFKNKISTIYVGPEDKPAGREFLERLARATGGESITADRAKELASSVQTLLLKA